MNTNQTAFKSLTQSTSSRLYQAHSILGSIMSDGCMPKTIRVNLDQPSAFKGALSVLNQMNYSALDSEISLARVGFILQKKYHDGISYLKTGIPVYSGAGKEYKNMLVLNLACGDDIALGGKPTLHVVPSVLESAGKAGDFYWANNLSLAENASITNPFDYCQALLPKKLKYAKGNDHINPASLCQFMSEMFRFLNPEDRALYLRIMMRNNRFDKFIKYAASTRNHHNQEHGLLIHTAETLANVILAACRTSPDKQNSTQTEFDLSLTLLAALLHDVAKVEDYYRLAPGAYTTNLNCDLLGHEQTVMKWIAVACATPGTYPSDRELRLEHAVSAVNREHDQTGARRRKTKESFVLHDADCASARNFDKGIESVLISQHFVQGESA